MRTMAAPTTRDRASRRPRVPRTLVAAVLVACLTLPTLLAGCNDPGASTSPGPQASLPAGGVPGASPGAAPGSDDPDDPGDDPDPTPVPGPDLGVAEVAPIDPELLVPSPYGLVPSDRLWFLLPEGSTEADAARVAGEMQGTIGGRIEVADAWLVLIPPQSPDGLLAALELAAEIEGIDAAFPDVEMIETTDCAPELTTGIYGSGRADPYAMIGVADAWQVLFASGLKRTPVHVGIVDSQLTRDPAGTIPWEFDNATWVGDPVTTPQLRVDDKGALQRGGFHHADGVLGIVAGDLTDGGIAGIASPLGGDLLVSHGAYGDFKDDGGNMDPDVEFDYGGRVGHVSGVLVEVKRQIERGATVINLSVGPTRPHPAYAGQAALWRRFFTKMEKEHPQVLFVAAAGNESGQLDGHNYGPGGIAAPNVITVGSVQTDGSVTSYSNAADPTAVDGEVTIHAPGDQAVWGTGADGTVIAKDGGTSSATPMVTAAAALIRSIDPTLTASQVKDLLFVHSDTLPDANVLRVEAALRQAVDDVRARAGIDPLTDEEIAAAACEMDVWGVITGESTDPVGVRWQVSASLQTLAAPTHVTLTMGGARPGNWRQAVAAAGQEVGWSLLVPPAGVDIKVTRLDNGYWRVFHLRGTPAAPTPAPTPEPTPTPRPTPADPGYDCTKPPPRGTIAYLNWSLHCKAIAP